MDNTSLKFTYPEYVPILETDKVGGEPTAVEIPDTSEVDGVVQLFHLSGLYTVSNKQYQKLFIYNTSTEEAQDIQVYGYNKNNNNIVSFAIERGQDTEYVLNGKETVKGYHTEPGLYVNYSFVEIQDSTPMQLNISIPPSSALGVWVKLEFDDIDQYNINDEFIIGVTYKDSSNNIYTSEKKLYHTRYDASVNIIQVKNSESSFSSYSVEFEWKDTTPVGVQSNDAFYAVYVDRIFIKEITGVNVFEIEDYSEQKPPITIELFLLPSSGYRPQLEKLESSKRHRIVLEWESNMPSVDDVERHLIYWDKGTGSIQEKLFAEVDASSGIGGGDDIEVCELIQ